jgi:hypothetical protein
VNGTTPFTNPFGVAQTTSLPNCIIEQDDIVMFAIRSSDSTPDDYGVFQFALRSAPLVPYQSNVLRQNGALYGNSCAYFKGAWYGLAWQTDLSPFGNVLYQATEKPLAGTTWNFTNISLDGFSNVI